MEIEKFFLREFETDNNVRKKGGEALVSKAWHPRFGEVAIKEWITDAHNIANEIELLIQNLNHPNIIQFVGMLMNNKSTYTGYIMPYMPLGSLEDGQIGSVIHNKKKNYNDIYTDEQKTKWITQICYGLSHLHFKKIIHRDIKPSNILLGNFYDVKLSDFGMARSLKNINHTLTKLGTPVYMAPEIFEGAKYDFSADIYSLSITIWEILHRRIPYDHITVQLHLPYKISNGERPQLNKNLSAEVSDLLKRCWDADPSNRPTIDYVREFCRETTFSLVEPENAVNECETSLKHLHVHNNHYESLTQIALKTQNEKFHILKPIEESTEKQTILLVGGNDGKNIFNTLLMLENNGQNWKQLNIKNAAAAVVNGKIFIFGGWSEDYSKSIECYDPSSDVWTLICKMPQEIRGHGAVEINGNFIIMGGRTHFDYLNGVWALDTMDKNAIWINKESMSIPRKDFSIAKINEKIFICGGYSEKNLYWGEYSETYFDGVEIFDGEVWRDGPKMPTTRRFAPAVVIPMSFARCLN